MAEHGTRRSYSIGCRCARCKSAQAQYQREYKARKAGADLPVRPVGHPRLGSVSALPVSPQVAQAARVAEPGAAERAVLDELASLSSAESRLGAVQAALALARVLDNPLALTQHTAAAKALPGILDGLRQGSARRKGRLASVQAMTKTAAAATGT